jgi:diguanylate cyclase (GGDEF)-like protein
MMLDLDKFKTYNDTYGHPTGDKLLAQLGDILRQNARTIDFPARYGGEEFAVILPECGAAEAAALAEKIPGRWKSGFPRQRGHAHRPHHRQHRRGDLRSRYGHAPARSPRLIAVADSALYQAKQVASTGGEHAAGVNKMNLGCRKPQVLHPALSARRPYIPGREKADAIE